MATQRASEGKSSQRRQAPARTPEQRENQLIASAVDLAEKQLKDGSASAQVITHYLKLGSSREKLEQERMKMEIALGEAKRENMAALGRIEELYVEAVDAMRRYAGQDPPSSREDDDYYDD